MTDKEAIVGFFVVWAMLSDSVPAQVVGSLLFCTYCLKMLGYTPW